MCLVFRTFIVVSLIWWNNPIVTQEAGAQAGKPIQNVDIVSTATPLPSGAQQNVASQAPTVAKDLAGKPAESLITTDTTKQVAPVKPELVITDTTKERVFVEPIAMMVTDTSKIPAASAESLKATDTTQTVPVEPVSLVPTGTMQPSAESKKEEQKPVETKKEEVKKEVEKSTEIKKEEKPKTLAPEEEEIKGIDTVDLEEPRGNWLFKRIWWNRAENKYEKIRTLFGNILEARLMFFTKRSTADRDLFAPFYFEIGMNNGELQETVSQLLKHIEKERKQEGDLSAQARDMLNVLMREKKSLESINADILTVNKLDTDIDATVKKLMEQIDRARKYEREAWNNFKDIAHVLSDKKARELFYQMDTAYNNLKDIQEYINQALGVHLDRVVGMAKSQIERIKSTIDKLKKEGHDLRTLADQISGKLAAKPAPVEEEEKAPEEEEEQGFFARTFSAITSGIVGIWDAVVYVVTLPFSWFSSGEPSEPNEQE